MWDGKPRDRATGREAAPTESERPGLGSGAGRTVLRSRFVVFTGLTDMDRGTGMWRSRWQQLLLVPITAAPPLDPIENRFASHLELVRCFYNFIRSHRALMFGKMIRTPAVQAGLVS